MRAVMCAKIRTCDDGAYRGRVYACVCIRVYYLYTYAVLARAGKKLRSLTYLFIHLCTYWSHAYMQSWHVWEISCRHFRRLMPNLKRFVHICACVCTCACACACACECACACACVCACECACACACAYARACPCVLVCVCVCIYFSVYILARLCFCVPVCPGDCVLFACVCVRQCIYVRVCTNAFVHS